MNPQDNSDGMTISNNHVRETGLMSHVCRACGGSMEGDTFDNVSAVSKRLCSAITDRASKKWWWTWAVVALTGKLPIASLWAAASIGLHEHAVTTDHVLKMGCSLSPITCISH